MPDEAISGGVVAAFRERLRAHDPAACAELDATCRRVARLARRRLGLPRSDVDDLAQETAKRAVEWRTGSGSNAAPDIGAWLYGIAENVARERLRELMRDGGGTAAIEAAKRSARSGGPARIPLRSGRPVRDVLSELPHGAPWMSAADRALCDAVLRHPGDRAAAAAAGLPRTTLRRRVADLARRAMARDSEDSGNLRGPPS